MLTFFGWGRVFKFECVVYGKYQYYFKRKICNYEINSILWKIKFMQL
jgi:hypothetical protein